jgi:hypothetical protein
MSSVSVSPSVVSAVCGRFRFSAAIPSCARNLLRIACLDGAGNAAALAAFASHSFRAREWRSQPMADGVAPNGVRVFVLYLAGVHLTHAGRTQVWDRAKN